MTAAMADLAPSDTEQVPADEPSGSRLSEWLASIFGRRYAAIASAAAVIVIGSLVAWNVVLQIDRANDSTGPSLDSAAFLYDLEGTAAAPGASGAVYRASDTLGLLVLNNLPSAPAGSEFQLWRIKGSAAIPEDTFALTGSGQTIIAVKADVADAETIGITIEPAGGSLQPTGDVLLLKQS